MPEVLLRLVGNLAALWAATQVFDGVTYGDSFGVLLAAAVVFTIANWIVKPVVTVLAIPLIVISLGVAYFFVNVLMLVLTAWVVGDFEVGGFWTVVGATIVVWLVNLAVSAAMHDWAEYGKRRRRRRGRR